MKRFFSTAYTPNAISLALLVLRLVAGGFMITHGLPKLTNMLAGTSQFGDPIGIGSELSLGLTVFAEFVCAILLVLGLATRFATIPLIITMAVAAFVAHGNDPFGKKEMSLLYLAMYVALLITGPGKYSVDQALVGKRKR